MKTIYIYYSDPSKCFYKFTTKADTTCLESSEFWILCGSNQLVGYCKNCPDFKDEFDNKKIWRANLIRDGHQFLGEMTLERAKKYMIFL